MGLPLESFLALALMVSFRRFTEDREMRRIGLSFERRMGLCSGVEKESCGKVPGMMNFLNACFKLVPEKRLDLEYRRFDDCGGNRASVHGTPRKSEKKEDTSGDEYACTTT